MKRDIVEDTFDIDTARKILAMPLSFRRPRDRRIWRYTKHGFFTVRSAYHVAVSKYSHIRDNRPSGSSTPKEWKDLWKLKVIPRVRLFLWKVCNNSLPTRVNLCKRGVHNDPLCLLCGEEQESSDHLLLQVFNVEWSSRRGMEAH